VLQFQQQKRKEMVTNAWCIHNVDFHIPNLYNNYKVKHSNTYQTGSITLSKLDFYKVKINHFECFASDSIILNYWYMRYIRAHRSFRYSEYGTQQQVLVVVSLSLELVKL
jgi:hypothetical protein